MEIDKIFTVVEHYLRTSLKKVLAMSTKGEIINVLIELPCWNPFTSTLIVHVFIGALNK